MVPSTRVASRNGGCLSPAVNPLPAWLGVACTLTLTSLDDVKLRNGGDKAKGMGKSCAGTLGCQIPCPGVQSRKRD